MIRGDWKYLHQDGHDYLFNVVKDARERANVANRYPEKLTELRDAWLDWNTSLPPIPDDARVFKLFQPGDMAMPSGTH